MLKNYLFRGIIKLFISWWNEELAFEFQVAAADGGGAACMRCWTSGE